MKELKGKAVYLRELKEEDMKGLHQALSNDEIRYMTGTRNSFTMEQMKNYFKRISEDQTRYNFSIRLLETDELIGDLAIMDIDEDNKKAGFRIALHQTSLLNKGYGTDALNQALKFAFEVLKLNRLQLEVFSHNIRGIKSYEKAGFQVEGVLRESLYYEGAFSDEIIMSMLQKDYFERKSEALREENYAMEK
ncbi:GNAT family N-acetyltransferase [Jeotgalibacillus proteolyticus]|uniref:GNAT family N-acetyltransferase n=1 Tax=Jeotgalibacillus proteolyticus TaxID=2082395 RepID=A0A2S5GBG6_9BACL|nr:GNAT family protein [Jeotgalibacillus proteolyticus]PPA70350.1 GNAT family N-acetyltransferase [Jeotgalibacillus proteolyticus]